MKMLRMGEVVVLEEEKAASECSSGCESGWTMYLDQSYEKPTASHLCKKGVCDEEEGEHEEEEEEDLSMVSDASSGPPHFHDDVDCFYCCNHCGESGCFCSASFSLSSAAALVKKGGKRRRVEAEQAQVLHKEEPCDYLDDTASSPPFTFSNNNIDLGTAKNPSVENVLEISYGFSATHFKRKPTFHKQFSYLKPTSAKPTCREGNNLW